MNFQTEDVLVQKAEAVQNEGGQWLPQVEVSFERDGIHRSIKMYWKEKVFDTKDEAENYAATSGVMAIKQRLNQGVLPEELEQE